jgi:hypothetical protein
VLRFTFGWPFKYRITSTRITRRFAWLLDAYIAFRCGGDCRRFCSCLQFHFQPYAVYKRASLSGRLYFLWFDATETFQFLCKSGRNLERHGRKTAIKFIKNGWKWKLGRNFWRFKDFAVINLPSHTHSFVISSKQVTGTGGARSDGNDFKTGWHRQGLGSTKTYHRNQAAITGRWSV